MYVHGITPWKKNFMNVNNIKPDIKLNLQIPIDSISSIFCLIYHNFHIFIYTYILIFFHSKMLYIFVVITILSVTNFFIPS